MTNNQCRKYHMSHFGVMYIVHATIEKSGAVDAVG